MWKDTGGKRFKPACASGSFPVALSPWASWSDLHSPNPTFASWENSYQLLLIPPEAPYAPFPAKLPGMFLAPAVPHRSPPTTPRDPHTTAPITLRGSFAPGRLVPPARPLALEGAGSFFNPAPRPCPGSNTAPACAR